MHKSLNGIAFVLILALTGCAAASITPEALREQVGHVKNGVTAIAAVNESDQAFADVPVTFGQIFKEGDVPQGAHLRALVDGKTIPIQVDRKATNADGSLRHAIVTVVVPNLPGSATRLVTLATGGNESSSAPVTLGAVLATDFDATVALNVNGQTLTADARSLLEQARADAGCHPWAKQCNLWLSGPQVSEWIVGGPLHSPNGPSPHLAVYFYVRAYAGKPIHQVRVNVVIENDWAWVPDPHNITYDAKITVGDRVYQKTNIHNYAHTRWHHVLWWGDKADVYARLDGRYIQASKAVSRYDPAVHPTDAFLDSVRQSVEPMGHGDQTLHMSDTGAQNAIGPLPRWTTAYLLSMDRRAFLWMLANDDAAGSYNVFYRDQNTGRPVSLAQYPYMTIRAYYGDTYNPATKKHEAFPKCDGDCKDPNVPNGAHEPSIGYLSYIVTGDFYYLEQLQFWANWNVVRMNPHYRKDAEGLVKSEQVRGQAWELRALADAAYITPDAAPLKSYFVDMVQNNIAWYNQHYPDNPDANKLGVITNGYAIVYDNNGSHAGPYVRLATWQDDYFTWAMSHLVDLGFDNAKAILRWKAQFAVGRMVAPGFCYVYASSYTLRVRDRPRGPIYDTFQKVYLESVPAKVSKMSCASSEMAEQLGRHYEPGDMVGFPWSPTGYPAFMQPALAAAVDADVPGAAAAWKLFMARPTKPDYTNDAKYAIVPRTNLGTVPN